MIKREGGLLEGRKKVEKGAVMWWSWAEGEPSLSLSCE